MPTLIVEEGLANTQRFELARRTVSIDRAPSRDLQLFDLRVSRRHALIRSEGCNHRLVPLPNLNGVHINGRPVKMETVLQDGDVLHVGATVLRYRKAEDCERTANNPASGRAASPPSPLKAWKRTDTFARVWPTMTM